MGRISSYLRVGFLLLILNSGYLLSSNAASIFYAANVLFHVSLATGLTGLAIYVYRRLPRNTLVHIVLGASALTGMALVVLGAGTATRPILLAHIAIASLAAAAVVVALSSKLAVIVLGLLFGAVWFMGTEETQDDFVRELLFGEITQTRYLSCFVILLTVIALLRWDSRSRARKTESDETKRLSDERSKWQERALGTDLEHTSDHSE